MLAFGGANNTINFTKTSQPHPLVVGCGNAQKYALGNVIQKVMNQFLKTLKCTSCTFFTTIFPVVYDTFFAIMCLSRKGKKYLFL